MFENVLDNFNTITETLDNLGDFAMPMVCMLLDYIAAKQEMQTVELLDYLRPVIEGVNDQFGGNTVGIIK